MKYEQHLCSLLSLFVTASVTFAQTYIVDARIAPEKRYSSHLKMGGHNFLGQSLEVNNYYMSVDGKPSIPITGEFH